MQNGASLPDRFVELGVGLPVRLGDAAAVPPGGDGRLLGRLSADVDVAHLPVVSDGAVEAHLALGFALSEVAAGSRPVQQSNADVALWRGRVTPAGDLPAGWWLAVGRAAPAEAVRIGAEALIERGVLRDTIVTFAAGGEEAGALEQLEREVAGWVAANGLRFDAAGVVPLQATDPHQAGRREVLVFLRAPRLLEPRTSDPTPLYRLRESGSDLVRRYSKDGAGSWKSTGLSFDVGHLTWAADGVTPVVSGQVRDALDAVAAEGCHLTEIDGDAWAVTATRPPVELDWRQAQPVRFRDAATSEVVGLPVDASSWQGADVATTTAGDLLVSGRVVARMQQEGLLALDGGGDDPPAQSLYAEAIDRVRIRRTAPQLVAAGMDAPDYLWLREPVEDRPAHLGSPS